VNVQSVGEICEFKYGSALPENARKAGKYGVYGSNGTVGTHSASITAGETIVIGRKGSVGRINFSDAPCWPIDTTYYIDKTCTQQDLRWLSYALDGLNLPALNKATGVPGLNRNDAYERRLVVPPLAEQKRIAAILDQADDLRRKRREALRLLDGLATSLMAKSSAPSFAGPIPTLPKDLCDPG
jgi:type I restriction enzyme, S subunit